MSLDPVRLAEALRLHRGGQYDEARGAYEQLLAAHPTDANLWQLLGLIDQQTGNLAGGRQRLERAIRLDPTLAEAHTNLGTILQELGELDAALASHERAIAFNPSLASAYFNLANAKRALGDLPGAEHSYRQAIELNPHYVKAYNNLAIVLRKQLKLVDAKLAAQRALGRHHDESRSGFASDTAIAHLAGALGVPTWVALPYVPDWRWLLNRGDSPWYPTMRLFRQPSPGNWSAVFEQIYAALNERQQPKTT